jgi:hypothetical protein
MRFPKKIQIDTRHVNKKIYHTAVISESNPVLVSGAIVGIDTKIISTIKCKEYSNNS